MKNVNILDSATVAERTAINVRLEDMRILNDKVKDELVQLGKAVSQLTRKINKRAHNGYWEYIEDVNTYHVKINGLYKKINDKYEKA